MYAYCAVNKPAKMEWWALRFIECMSNLYLLICEMNHRFLVKCGGWFLFLELSDSCVCVFFLFHFWWMIESEWRINTERESGFDCAYLECGINNGEPIDGGGMVGVGNSAALLTAAVSGCKKFRRWSTRSWCCVRHRPIMSGSASTRS